jgi:hypothetical protein
MQLADQQGAAMELRLSRRFAAACKRPRTDASVPSNPLFPVHAEKTTAAFCDGADESGDEAWLCPLVGQVLEAAMSTGVDWQAKIQHVRRCLPAFGVL